MGSKDIKNQEKELIVSEKELDEIVDKIILDFESKTLVKAEKDEKSEEAPAGKLPAMVKPKEKAEEDEEDEEGLSEEDKKKKAEDKKKKKLEKEKEKPEEKKEEMGKAQAEKFDKIIELLEQLTKSQQPKVEDKKPSELEELRKSMDERLEKALKVVDFIKKENEELKKSNAEIKKDLSKPARPRQSIANLQAIEKSQPEERQFTTKKETLEALEDLRKAGKITDLELVKFNVSNMLSENCKVQLRKMK